MSKQCLKLGIIGCGVIAPFHIEALQSIPDVRVSGVADIAAPKARSLATRYGIDLVTNDYRQLFKDNVDIIDICAPSGLHYNIGISAIEAGKHVIVEKPLALNLRQADEMIGAAAKAGVKLCVIFDRRFDRASVAARKALVEGRFGKLLLLDAQVKWYRTEEYYDVGWRGTWGMDGGGVLANQAIHWVDLLQWFGGPVARVFGRIKTVTHNIEGADLAVANIEFQNGALGVIEASTSIYPGSAGRGLVYASLPDQFGIYGEKGSAIMEESRLSLWEFKEGGRTEEAGVEEPTQEKFPTGHYAELKQMIQAIRSDAEVPVDGAEGKKSLEITRAIYYSSLTGTQVTFPFNTKQDEELDELIAASMKP